MEFEPVETVVSDRSYTYPEFLEAFFPNEDYKHDSLCLHCGQTFNRIKSHICQQYNKPEGWKVELRCQKMKLSIKDCIQSSSSSVITAKE